MPDDADLKPRQKQIDDLWRTFREYRGEQGTWTNLRRRRAPGPQSDDDLDTTIQIQSAILESELVVRKQVLELEAPKVDAVSLEHTAGGDENKAAKQDAEDCRLYFARLMADWQERYDVSGVNSTGQIANGGQMWRLLWKMPPEPPADWTEGRDEWFRQYKGEVLGLRRVPIGSVGFFPLDKPEYVIEEIDLPYMEWRKLKGNGKYLRSVEDFKRVAFVGDAQEIDLANANHKVRICTHAYQVPDTEDWKVVEYAYPDGSDAGQGEVWQEYDSPFGNPYEWCSSGAEIGIETDPHLRFRPDLYPLYVTTMEQNNWLTLLARVALKRMSHGNLYVPLYGTQADVVQAWLANEVPGSRIESVGEGAGALRRGVVPVQETSPGEYFLAPRLEPIPIEIPEAMMTRIQQLELQQQSERSSRFLTGNVSEAEITQGTASAIVGQTQQAALPSSVHLRHQARWWRSIFRKLQKAIIYWSEGLDAATQKKYYVIASGEEPVAGKKVDPGSEVYVNADKMKRSMEILVYISNLTASERAEKDATAWYRYDRGAFTFEQLLDELGFEDPGVQQRELNRERHLVEARLQFAQQEADERANLWSALTGLSLTATPPPALAMPPSMGGGAAPSPPRSNGMMPPQVNGPATPLPSTPSGVL